MKYHIKYVVQGMEESDTVVEADGIRWDEDTIYLYKKDIEQDNGVLIDRTVALFPKDKVAVTVI